MQQEVSNAISALFSLTHNGLTHQDQPPLPFWLQLWQVWLGGGDVDSIEAWMHSSWSCNSAWRHSVGTFAQSHSGLTLPLPVHKSTCKPRNIGRQRSVGPRGIASCHCSWNSAHHFVCFVDFGQTFLKQGCQDVTQAFFFQFASPREQLFTHSMCFRLYCIVHDFILIRAAYLQAIQCLLQCLDNLCLTLACRLLPLQLKILARSMRGEITA